MVTSTIIFQVLTLPPLPPHRVSGTAGPGQTVVGRHFDCFRRPIGAWRVHLQSLVPAWQHPPTPDFKPSYSEATAAKPSSYIHQHACPMIAALLVVLAHLVDASAHADLSRDLSLITHGAQRSRRQLGAVIRPSHRACGTHHVSGAFWYRRGAFAPPASCPAPLWLCCDATDSSRCLQPSTTLQLHPLASVQAAIAAARPGSAAAAIAAAAVGDVSPAAPRVFPATGLQLPIVFHIIQWQDTMNNVSNDQLLQQVAVLNRDFTGKPLRKQKVAKEWRCRRQCSQPTLVQPIVQHHTCTGASSCNIQSASSPH